MSKEQNVFDVVVVGSGAAGAAVSWRLATSTNLNIACVEQGEFTTPDSYPTNFADWEVRSNLDYSYRSSTRKNWGDYEIDDSASPVKIANFNGVGGSTVLFSGHFPRMHPSDFRVRTLDGVAEDWPITYKELEHYYSLNDSKIGVAGLTGDPAYPEIDNLLPPVPLGLLGERIASGLNSLDWHWWPSYSAINTSSRHGRPRCVNLGPCNTGCAQGAKSSADVTYWPLAIQNGVKLITSTRVTGIGLNSQQDRVKEITYVNSSGKFGTLKTKCLIIAANGIGTARLLLANSTKRFPNGIGNNSGMLGKNLMLHPLAYIEGVAEDDLQSSIGPQGCCLQSQEFHETSHLRHFKRGFTLQVLRSPGPYETARQGIRRGKISLGSNFQDQFSKYFNKTISLSMICEDLPETYNSVTLSPKKDSFGFSIPKVNYTISKNTKEILKFAIARGREVLQSIGAEEVLSYAPVSFSGWHLLGTARMGSDSDNSVTNKFGRVHDLENLYIADGSLFVTSGSVNPASTIQALALFVADHIET